MEALIYVRISQDRSGEAQGSGRQLDDCRALAARKGWRVVEEIVDNDFTAFDQSRPRPGWRRVHELLNDGTARALIAWHPDRMLRSLRELEDLVDLVERVGAVVETCTAGDHDLRTPEGRLVARITGSVAVKESEDKSRRLRRKHEQLAAEGRPHGGRRSFGFTARMEPVPVEQMLMRDGAAMLLDGASLTDVVRAWDASGVRPVLAHAWRITTVKQCLTSPTAAGLRAHRGEVLGPATWAPVLDRVTWERLRAQADGRRRGGGAAQRLLTGLLECGGVCRQPMFGGRGWKRMATYVCDRGCVQIRGEDLEDLVVGLALPVLVALPRLEGRKAVPVEDHAAEAELVELAEMYRRGELLRAEWLVLRAPLLERVRAAARGVVVGLVLPRIAQGRSVRDAWAEDWTLGQQRAALAVVIERIVVPPAGSPVWDPDRPRISWRL